jgi:hypothetical protein
MKQVKTIQRRIKILESRIVKFSSDETLDKILVKSAIKRIKTEIKILKWVLN